MLFLASLNLCAQEGSSECAAQFQFDSFDLDTIDLTSSIDGTLPTFLDDGILLSFGPFTPELGANPALGEAIIVPSPANIDGMQALSLNGTNAIFNIGQALPAGTSATGLSIQIQGSGLGANYNLSVNGNLPYIGTPLGTPQQLTDGISSQLIGSSPTSATLVLTGDLASLEIGGTLILGSLCVIAEEQPVDITGCTQPEACNYNPEANVDDGSCVFESAHFFSLTLTTDQYPAETSWSLTDAEGNVVMEGGPYNQDLDNNTTILVTQTLCAGCYTMTLNDAFGDGMCCQYGDGGYALTVDDELVASGGQFTFSDATDFCTPNFGGGGGGCTYEVAVNFDPSALYDDGTCQFEIIDPCLNDADGDGVCDEDEVLGCTGPCSCNYDALATDDDGSCIFVDALGICGGFCSADLDGDGECDDVDCCVGGFDECGVCNGPGGIFECGCNAMPLGACDCQGNMLDVLGVCGGDCMSDADSDGICDNVDDCIGNFDQCGICNGPGPIFSCGCFILSPGDCDCEGNQLDAVGICGGDCPGDTDGDGICDTQEIPGCTDLLACNYNPQATDDIGDCVLPAPGYGCDGLCVLDSDGDGICDDFEISGCTDQGACNFYPEATDNAGCIFPAPGFNCSGECILDVDQDGICDSNEVIGCTVPAACNYNANATENDGNCVFPPAGFGCDGTCLEDLDGDGICDFLELTGCTNPAACNYNPDAQQDNGSCIIPPVGYGCDGFCLGDGDDDGICDVNEISGCTDPFACNFMPNATDPSNSCEYPQPGFNCEGICLDNDQDGICNLDEVDGCTYTDADNFNESATEDDGSCTFSTSGSGCPDLDGDGIVAISDLLTMLGAFGDQTGC